MRYFKYHDHLGLNPDGSQQPIVEVGLPVSMPVMIGGDPHVTRGRAVLKPILAHEGGLEAVHPDSRTVATDNPHIAAYLLESGQYAEIDRPKSAERHVAHAVSAEEKAATRGARRVAKLEQAGPPLPVADDAEVEEIEDAEAEAEEAEAGEAVAVGGDGGTTGADGGDGTDAKGKVV